MVTKRPVVGETSTSLQGDSVMGATVSAPMEWIAFVGDLRLPSRANQDGEPQDPERPPASLRTTVMIHARFLPQRVPRGTKGVGRRSALGHAPQSRCVDST